MGGGEDCEVRAELADAAAVRADFELICDLYDEVFSEPPFSWQSDETGLHRQRLERLLTERTFGAALAHEGERLVGFAYGFALKPTTSWWSGIDPPQPLSVTAERPGRTFVLFDFGVQRGYRGRGIGHTLHDMLLGSRREKRATLATQPPAVQTKRCYERWGWYLVGQAPGGPSAAAPLFDIYLRDSIDDLRRLAAAARR